MIYIVGTHHSDENCGSRATIYGVATNEEKALDILHELQTKVEIDGFHDDQYCIWERDENVFFKDWIG